MLSVSTLPESVTERLSAQEAAILAEIASVPDACTRWANITSKLLSPSHDFELHSALHAWNYAGEDFKPIWLPSEDAKNSNIAKIMAKTGFTSYADFYNYSITSPEEFWRTSIEAVDIAFDTPFERVFDDISPDGVKSVSYLPGAKLNIVNSCFNKRPSTDAALIFASENDPTLHCWSNIELRTLANRISNALLTPTAENQPVFAPGDAIGICMAMTPEAVAIYLGVIQAGLTVVSIADSFSTEEIATRLRISNAKAIFTQDVIYRSDKHLPLFSRVQATDIPTIFIVPGKGTSLHSSVESIVRPADINFYSFLSNIDTFTPLSVNPGHIANILFSSGTTGEPKAIPWTHATPLKCAIDGFYHQDVRVGEVVAWPTNIGWMMGPWLIYQMINGATIALFNGITSTSAFCKFVEHANVSMLGVVPSLVKSWKASHATKLCDWTKIRRFSSTGEASDAAGMHWLSATAGYAPIIEYCGGTEVAGSYLSSTMVQANVSSSFSSPVLGSNIDILDAATATPADVGEIVLIPPAMGLSTMLLNKNHHQVYYDDMPQAPSGKVYRRHGDEIQRIRYADNLMPYYRALGRCDDTMNLGGIKISSVEIERVCTIPHVKETAAIAVSKSGPSLLVIYTVLSETADAGVTSATLKPAMQQSIRVHLNPLFHIYDVVIVESLPRTASNKVMRRLLRDMYKLE